MSFTVILAYLVGAVYLLQETLVCASVMVRVKAWGQLSRQLGSARHARVARGDGEDGLLARRCVEQVGRRGGDGKVVFADRSHTVDVFGGTIETLTGNEALTVPRSVAPPSGVVLSTLNPLEAIRQGVMPPTSAAPEASDGGEAPAVEPGASLGGAGSPAAPATTALGEPPVSAELTAPALPLFLDSGDLRVSVWISPARALAAAAPPEDLLEQAKVRAQAARARGYVRSLELALREGDEVWFWQGEQGRMILSDQDPRRVAAGARRKGILITMLIAVITLGSLVLALWPPLFGTLSTIGGVLALANFLISLKWGKDAVEQMRDPSLLDVRGTWPAR